MSPRSHLESIVELWKYAPTFVKTIEWNKLEVSFNVFLKKLDLQQNDYQVLSNSKKERGARRVFFCQENKNITHLQRAQHLFKQKKKVGWAHVRSSRKNVKLKCCARQSQRAIFVVLEGKRYVQLSFLPFDKTW